VIPGGCQQPTFDDLPDVNSGRAVATIASILTIDLARIAVRVTEFWRSVSIRGEDECWPWTGYLNEDGYGEFFFAGKMRGAHELAVTFTTAEVRPGHVPQLRQSAVLQTRGTFVSGRASRTWPT